MDLIWFGMQILQEPFTDSDWLTSSQMEVMAMKILLIKILILME